jgi:hypothetical protein
MTSDNAKKAYRKPILAKSSVTLQAVTAGPSPIMKGDL